jgi:positive regulator of sigma E activity
MNRKDFFRTGGRLLLLGGITTSAGYLLVNKKVTASCSVSPACNNCGEFSKCELPQAKEVKDGKRK